MIQVNAQTKILVAINPIDFRCGIDSLGGLIKNNYRKDPMDGTLFVFTNRRKDGLKFLYYDFQGYWLCHKRFSCGKLSWWPADDGSNEGVLTLDHRNLLLLIYNGDPHTLKFHSNWKQLT
jgi:transposase